MTSERYYIETVENSLPINRPNPPPPNKDLTSKSTHSWFYPTITFLTVQIKHKDWCLEGLLHVWKAGNLYDHTPLERLKHSCLEISILVNHLTSECGVDYHGCSIHSCKCRSNHEQPNTWTLCRYVCLVLTVDISFSQIIESERRLTKTQASLRMIFSRVLILIMHTSLQNSIQSLSRRTPL